MKVAVLTVFKNEADVLPAWLKHMEDKVDYFLFRDNESTDEGSEIVKNHPKTVFYEKVEGEFTTSMWDKLIEEAQKYLYDIDWFMISAPDLFPFFDIKFEISKMELRSEAPYNCIETYYPNFFFTKEMYFRYKVDVEYKEKIKHFDINNYQFFYNVGHKMSLLIQNIKHKGQRVRYTKPKQEPPVIPKKTIFKSNLCIGHYRFRSPKQMKERMILRKKVNPDRIGKKSFKHYPTWDWFEYLISESLLHKFNGSFKKEHLNKITLENLIRKNKG